jgi:carotenoid cleavage dioxygenase
MTAPADAPPSLPFHLTGNYAPVMQEVTAHDLRVQGVIPEALRGWYVRNGPNPKRGTSPHWFLGDGMLHGVALRDGKALWYRNRWVRTRAFVEDAPARDEAGVRDLTVGLANTHVIGHAGRVLALVETSLPTEVSCDLETLGNYDFGGRLTTGMTAHPKICPRTGEMHFFAYGYMPPFLTYHRADAAGRLVQSEQIEVPGPTMIHDFAITERHVLFMDLPVIFDLELALAGKLPYRWSDDHGARIGVMPRGGRNADVRWLEVAPCYVFHPLNAFEAEEHCEPQDVAGLGPRRPRRPPEQTEPQDVAGLGPRRPRRPEIVLDVVRYPELWRPGVSTFPEAQLHRWRIDLQAGRVHESPLDDRAIEFPRCDERRVGLPNRFGYVVHTGRGAAANTGTSLVKYDLRTGGAFAHDFGPGRVPGEAVMVPASPGAAEDEGWLLAFVYDAARDGSDLIILDAADVTAKPVASVPLPQRVPFGFHGSWLPES